MEKMLLLLDVGNTNMKLGLARQTQLSSYVLPTSRGATPDSLGLDWLAILAREGLGPEDVEAVVVSSVVPPQNPLLRGAAARYLGCPLYFTPEDLPPRLENRYAAPAEVGADRLVASLAARREFSEPGLIIIDFGTATTFDCVANEAYLGGLICPGVLSSASALTSHAAKLPPIDLDIESAELQIGRSTSASLSQGLVFGFAALVDGLVERLAKQLPRPLKIVATGGFAAKVARFCRVNVELRPELLLEGLRMIYVESRR